MFFGESRSFGHGAITHSHSQRSIHRDFPLFKRYEWPVGIEPSIWRSLYVLYVCILWN